jgi:hypothetical protein
MMKKLLLAGSHLGMLAIGFALGVYMLPILIAPEAPTVQAVQKEATAALFTGKFRKDLKDSDSLHWGEGTVSITANAITLEGELAPGPDYKLYLSPEFVETEADFNRLKPRMVRVGDVKTFRNFLVPLPPGVDPARYTTVVVWCESFGQFISAAKYK